MTHACRDVDLEMRGQTTTVWVKSFWGWAEGFFERLMRKMRFGEVICSVDFCLVCGVWSDFLGDMIGIGRRAVLGRAVSRVELSGRSVGMVTFWKVW